MPTSFSLAQNPAVTPQHPQLQEALAHQAFTQDSYSPHSELRVPPTASQAGLPFPTSRPLHQVLSACCAFPVSSSNWGRIHCLSKDLFAHPCTSQTQMCFPCRGPAAQAQNVGAITLIIWSPFADWELLWDMTVPWSYLWAPEDQKILDN